jgi:hypothetical protein
MDFGDYAEIDGESELYRSAFFQAEILGFDEDSVRA